MGRFTKKIIIQDLENDEVRYSIEITDSAEITGTEALRHCMNALIASGYHTQTIFEAVHEISEDLNKQKL